MERSYLRRVIEPSIPRTMLRPRLVPTLRATLVNSASVGV